MNNNLDNIEVKDKKKFKLNKKHIFGSIVIIAVLHLVLMAMPLVFKEQSKNLLGYQYQIVIHKNQELDEELNGQVMRIRPLELDEISIGDTVLIYGLYSNNYYWEVEVLEINQQSATIKATFDDVIRNTYHVDEVGGEVNGTSNFIGTFYYTASTPRGFVSMVILHALALFVTHYFMFQKKKKIEEGDLNEE